ncbi:MAG: YbhB/YbcL family Raf kinase inhibitor-like protein [Gemmatimonadota bacterium]
MPFEITSISFESGQPIPSRFTCEGENISPPLSWSGAPAATQSFVLIVDDPDAPDPAAPLRTWVHWVLYNIPADTDRLSADIAPDELPPGTVSGLNDWKRTTYGGPCPPIGRHRYYHTLYALDIALPRTDNATKFELLHAIEGHVLAKAELMGTYQRSTL